MEGVAGFLEGVVADVEATLERLLPGESEPPAALHAAMRYALFAGGKRIRPALVILGGEAYGAPRTRLLEGSAAMEMIHTFSLVHDDLPALDNDDLRRGRPTVHRQWNEATAVLVGDALLNLGLETLLERPAEIEAERRLRAAALVARAVGTAGMIGGQMADLEAERQWPEDPAAALEAIHRRKTGALLTASLRLGGVYAAADGVADGLLSALGRRIGLMFQIADDILDVEGTADRLGKSAHKDVEARKLTYPALHGLDASKRLLRELRDEGLELVSSLPARQEIVGALIDYVCSRDR